MFKIAIELEKEILDELESLDVVSDGFSDIRFDKDCSCSGGCGTYAPACACCGYQH